MTSTINRQAAEGPQAAFTMPAGAAALPVQAESQGERALPFPPGRLGDVAHYLWRNAHSPVEDFAIATAIGFFAGICGRGWIVSNTGLNHDIVILGPSGSGKNIVETGIFNIARQLQGVPISQFIFKGQMASAQALVKRMTTHPCFLQVIGEVGKLYSAYSKSRYGDNIDQLFTEKLRLWGSSGPNGASSGILYSDSEKNVEGGVLAGIAHSTLGDTTPRAFYDALKPAMWEQGFISRLWIIEYSGPHPDYNRDPIQQLPEGLRDYLRGLVNEAGKRVLGQQQIEFTPEAIEELETLTGTYRDYIGQAEGDEVELQLWVRAREKVLRLAGLMAVADNYAFPKIQVEHLNWAEMLLQRTNANILDRVGSGTIGGDSDHGREQMILDRIHRWITQPRRDPKDEALRQKGIVTKRFLQQETASLAPFRDHKLGATLALKLTMSSLVDQGRLADVKKGDAQVPQKMSFDDKTTMMVPYLGQCWRVLDLKRG